MRLEKFEEKHYVMLTEWWKKHNHPVMPFSSLSPFGFVCYSNEKPTCASFLYLFIGGSLGQIAWSTSNPDTSLRDRYRGLDFCIKGLLELAKHYGAKQVICFSSSKGLTKLIKKNNLTVGHAHDLLTGYFSEE